MNLENKFNFSQINHYIAHATEKRSKSAINPTIANHKEHVMDWVWFNVGGQLFNMSRNSLMNYKGSLLEMRYELSPGQKGMSIRTFEHPRKTALIKFFFCLEIWIARDPTLFVKLYTYLLHGNFELIVHEDNIDKILNEAQFYNLKVQYFNEKKQHSPQKTTIFRLLLKLIKKIFKVCFYFLLNF